MTSGPGKIFPFPRRRRNVSKVEKGPVTLQGPKLSPDPWDGPASPGRGGALCGERTGERMGPGQAAMHVRPLQSPVSRVAPFYRCGN